MNLNIPQVKEQMSRSFKINLILLTVSPFIYSFIFIFAIFSLIFLTAALESGVIFMLCFGVLIVIHFLFIFINIALLIYYIILAVKNENLTDNERLVWIIIIALGGSLALPVYWYLYIWKE